MSDPGAKNVRDNTIVTTNPSISFKKVLAFCYPLNAVYELVA